MILVLVFYRNDLRSRIVPKKSGIRAQSIFRDQGVEGTGKIETTSGRGNRYRQATSREASTASAA